MRGGRTRVSQYVAANNPSQWLIGGAESFVQDGNVLYKVLTFTSTGTLSVTSLQNVNAQYLVVAGGGGGGTGYLGA